MYDLKLARFSMNLHFFRGRTDVPLECVALLCFLLPQSFFLLPFLYLFRRNVDTRYLTVIARANARTPLEQHYTLLRPMELRENEEHRAVFLHHEPIVSCFPDPCGGNALSVDSKWFDNRARPRLLIQPAALF